MKRPRHYPFIDLFIELLIYCIFVALYLFCVFDFLSDWLKSMFNHNRIEYALAAFFLMFVQSVGLERLTTGLLALIRRRKR